MNCSVKEIKYSHFCLLLKNKPGVGQEMCDVILAQQETTNLHDYRQNLI